MQFLLHKTRRVFFEYQYSRKTGVPGATPFRSDHNIHVQLARLVELLAYEYFMTRISSRQLQIGLQPLMGQ